MESQFLYSGDDERNLCHGANLLQSRSGDLFACWYSYPDQEHIDGHIIFSQKQKNSDSWSAPKSVFPDYNSSLGNPVLFEDFEGTLVLIFVILKGYWDSGLIYLSLSTDAGISWTTPAPAGTPEGVLPRHQPVNIDQNYLVPLYNETDKTSSVWLTKPPFSDWKLYASIPGKDIIQPSLLTSDKKELFALFRPTGETLNIHFNQSSDLGKSWSNPMPTRLTTALSGYSSFLNGDKIFVIFNHTKEHKRTPLSLAYSSDQGTSWSLPWNIDSSDLELSYPSFLSAGDGTIHGLYTYNRRMIKYVKLSEKEIP